MTKHHKSDEVHAFAHEQVAIVLTALVKAEDEICSACALEIFMAYLVRCSGPNLRNSLLSLADTCVELPEEQITILSDKLEGMREKLGKAPLAPEITPDDFIEIITGMMNGDRPN